MRLKPRTKRASKAVNWITIKVDAHHSISARGVMSRHRIKWERQTAKNMLRPDGRWPWEWVGLMKVMTTLPFVDPDGLAIWLREMGSV